MICRSRGLLLPIVFALLGCVEAQQPLESISIHPVKGGQLVVQIREVSRLFVVLQELCLNVPLECDTAAVSGADVTVAPGTLSGSLSQVVLKLFEGAPFNFAVAERTADGRAMLVVHKKPFGSETKSSESRGANIANDVRTNVDVAISEPVATDSPSTDKTETVDSRNLDPNAQETNSDATPIVGGAPEHKQPAGDVLGRLLKGASSAGTGAPSGPPLPGIPTQSSVPPGPPLPGIPIIPSDGNGPLGPFPASPR